MKKFFNLLKEKFIKFKNYIKNDSFSFKKFLLLLGTGLLINICSGFLSSILIIASGLYLVVKGVIPTIKTVGAKMVDFVKKIDCKFKGIKKFNLFNRKKKIAKKKDIPNIIKNLKLFSTNKLNFNLKIKKDVDGYKIVNGSYKFKGTQIIDNKINLYTLEPIVENETEHSHKTYVKTK